MSSIASHIVPLAETLKRRSTRELRERFDPCRLPSSLIHQVHALATATDATVTAVVEVALLTLLERAAEEGISLPPPPMPQLKPNGPRFARCRRFGQLDAR